MSKVDLGLQMKFLNELDEALTDALARYQGDTPEKLAELNFMKQEVKRARRVIVDKITEEKVLAHGQNSVTENKSTILTPTYAQTVYS